MLLRHPAINNPPYNNTAFWEGSRRTHGVGVREGVGGSQVTSYVRGEGSAFVWWNHTFLHVIVRGTYIKTHIFAHLASLDLLFIPGLTSCCSHDNCDCESSRRGAIISI